MTQESNEQITNIQTRNQHSSPPPGNQEGRDGGRGLNPVLLEEITTDSDSSPPGNSPGASGTDRTINVE